LRIVTFTRCYPDILCLHMNKILSQIFNKLSKDNFIDEVATQLKGTEFNSLLLEIFRKRSETITPAQLLKEYEQNRFVQPAKTDTIKSREIELEWLKYAASYGFSALTLSPVAPFASCAAVGTVNQNKVLSSLKGTEVVSDATNLLALKIALDFKNEPGNDKITRYCTVHRHLRTQYFDNPNFSAHFSLFGMVTGGFDKGSYLFEIKHLHEHISVILALLKRSFELNDMYLKFYLKSENEQFSSLLKQTDHVWSKMQHEFITDLENKYYQTVQFKIFARINNEEINIADGGLVDWTQKLIGNKKHRLLISGVGLELMQRLMK